MEGGVTGDVFRLSGAGQAPQHRGAISVRETASLPRKIRRGVPMRAIDGASAAEDAPRVNTGRHASV